MTRPVFDPYRVWLGIPPSEQPPHHYRLLGIGLFESDPEVIANAADRQMAHVRTFQTGKYSTLSQQILNQLAAARVCLLHPARKAEYDDALRARITPGPPPVAATPPPASPPVAAPAPRPPHRPAAAPLAEAAPVPRIQTAPQLLRTRATGRRPIRRANPPWLTPVLAVIALVLLVAALALLVHFGPPR